MFASIECKICNGFKFNWNLNGNKSNLKNWMDKFHEFKFTTKSHEHDECR